MKSNVPAADTGRKTPASLHRESPGLPGPTWEKGEEAPEERIDKEFVFSGCAVVSNGLRQLQVASQNTSFSLFLFLPMKLSIQGL